MAKSTGTYDASSIKLVDVDLNEEAQRWKEKQQDELIIDFDQAVKEQEAKAIVVRFQGKEFRLPKSAPAWLPLFINRHADDKGQVADKHNLEMIENLLGKEFAKQITDEKNNFVSFELVNSKILKPVMDEWGFNQFKDTSKKK